MLIDYSPVAFSKLENAIFCINSLLSFLSAPIFNDSFENCCELEKELAIFLHQENLDTFPILEFGENFPFDVLLLPILETAECFLQEDSEEFQNNRIVDVIMHFCTRLRALIKQLGTDRLTQQGPTDIKFEIQLDITFEDLFTAFDSIDDIHNFYQQNLSEKIPSIKLDSFTAGRFTGNANKSEFISFINHVIINTEDHTIMGSPVLYIWVDNCFTIKDIKKAALLWKGIIL